MTANQKKLAKITRFLSSSLNESDTKKFYKQLEKDKELFYHTYHAIIDELMMEQEEELLEIPADLKMRALNKSDSFVEAGELVCKIINDGISIIKNTLEVFQATEILEGVRGDSTSLKRINIEIPNGSIIINRHNNDLITIKIDIETNENVNIGLKDLKNGEYFCFSARTNKFPLIIDSIKKGSYSLNIDKYNIPLEIE